MSATFDRLLVELGEALNALQTIAANMRTALAASEAALASVPEPVPAPPAPAPLHIPTLAEQRVAPPRSKARLYQLGDEQLTIAALAERGHCSPTTMYARLQKHSVAEAVAMGAPDRNRVGQVRLPPKPGEGPLEHGKGWSRQLVLYPFKGEKQTCDQLAKLARCHRSTMHERLKRMSAEDAVALGKDARKARKSAAAAPPAAPLEPVVLNRPPARSRQQPMTVAKPAPLVAPDAEPVRPPGLEPVTRARPLGRYEVAEVKSTFGRIGQYEETGSALSRALQKREQR